MRKKIILLVTVLIGIFAATAAFYFYESSKKIKPNEVKKLSLELPTPTPSSSIFLTVDEPANEQVFDKRIIKISGKTTPGAKIVILTQTDQEAAVSAKDGSFSTNISLSLDENILYISAVSPEGEVAEVKRVVTYSTEEF